MERSQIIALVVVAATAAVLGIRAMTGGEAASPDEDVGASARTAAGHRPVALPPHGAATERNARRSALVDQLPEHRQAPSDEPDDDARHDGRNAGAADVIAGAQRGASGVGTSGRQRTGPAPLAASGQPPAGAGAVPPRRGSTVSAPPSGPASAARPAADAPPEIDAVLLSIPLKGSVDPAQGESPTKTDGVVVNGDTVEFTDDAQYTLPAGGHVNGQSGSIVFDVEPRWNGSDQSNNSLLQIRDTDSWANNLQIVKNLDSLRFIMVDAGGNQSDVTVNIQGWQADEPHRIAATWGDTVMTLYVDGKPVGQAPIADGPVFKATTPIHIGSDFPGSQFASANARISNLTIYGRPLNAGELK